jgi:hypothetical protein
MGGRECPRTCVKLLLHIIIIIIIIVIIIITTIIIISIVIVIIIVVIFIIILLLIIIIISISIVSSPLSIKIQGNSVISVARDRKHYRIFPFNYHWTVKNLTSAMEAD